MSEYSTGDALLTIEDKQFSGWPDRSKFEIPETRMKDASATQNFAKRLSDNDQIRSRKRAKVNGLVDGNPPYKQSKLAAAGRNEAANFNAGTGRSFLESGSGAIYELATQAPGVLNFRTSFGDDPQMKELWSNMVCRNADLVFSEDEVWDYEEQISQWEEILHGCGPMFFEDEFKVLPRAIQCGDLKVPEFTKSDTHYWDACAIQIDYYPPELYAFIQDEKNATLRGWNVEFTKRVISRAMNIRTRSGIMYDWEFYQQQIKDNSLSFYDDSKICRLVHVFWKEFDGKVSHGIVERQGATGLSPEYCFIHVGRYASFKEAVHPMYYDHGNGGRHHSVTGLGVKMYSLMEYDNRLLCNLCDKAFAPKIIFKPTSTSASTKFEMTSLGDNGVIPAGWDWTQTGVAGLMNDGLVMRSTLQQVFQANLSNYKQGVTEQKTGNPVTKFEKQLESAMQSALSMPQYNRYYKQRDILMQEIWRRLTNPKTTDERAKKFQGRCQEQGIPREVLDNTEYVGAARIVGQGSSFMRSQAVDNILGTVGGSLPEDGLANLVRDKIACEAGQAAITRYYPVKQQGMPTDQDADARQWIACMKIGVPPVVTSSQNPVTHAAAYLKAASDALTSLQQGGDMAQVYAFLQIIGPAIAAQLQRFARDKNRAQVFKVLEQQWKQVASATDKLTVMLKQQDEHRKEQLAKTTQALSDEQIAAQKAQADIQIKQTKTAAQLQQSTEKHNLKIEQTKQDMALKDATTATAIHLAHAKAVADMNKPEKNGSGE